jgi:hypothetical protein
MRKMLVVAIVSFAAVTATVGVPMAGASAGDDAATGSHAYTVGHASSAPVAARPGRAAPSALPRGVQGLPASPALARAKADGAGAAGTPARGPSHQLRAAPNLPVKLQQFGGMYDATQSPGDATGAAGPNTIVQVINSRIGLYHRSGEVISSLGMGVFLGLPEAHCFSQPQVLWDPYTNMYYFSVLDYGITLAGGDCPSGQETLWYGWSRSAMPGTLTSSDWCALHFDDYGADNEIPDAPRLGDTKNFLLIGVNVFGPDTDPELPYLRSDVVALPKLAPSDPDVCPSTQTTYTFQNLSNEGTWSGSIDGAGVPAFSPVPVVQTDPSTTGWIVSADFNGSADAPYYGFNPTGGAYLGNKIGVFKVALVAGAPQLTGPTLVPVTAFVWPTNAIQMGSALRLDTQDGRVTQAMSGGDPVHATPLSQAGAVWFQHAVRGGPGSMVQWYEIDPAAATVLQSGTVLNPTAWVFNAAISSDRQVVAGQAGTVLEANYGESMVIGYDVSGSHTWVSLRMASKIGANPRSNGVIVHSSGGVENDYSCHISINGHLCRWGDYAGAVADPYESTTGHGHVWLVNQWITKSTSSNNADWRTFVWRANP